MAGTEAAINANGSERLLSPTRFTAITLNEYVTPGNRSLFTMKLLSGPTVKAYKSN